MKADLDANKAPFLPDQNGNIKAEPVYTLSQGYCLPASRLIPVQFEKMKKGYESNIVATRNQITEAGTELKDGEKGVLYNFKGKDENFHTAAVFFPEQTENPEVILDMAKDKINQPTNLKGLSLTIESAEPVEYLGSYIAACKSGMNLSVSLEIAEDFKKNIMMNVNNDLKKAENRDKNKKSITLHLTSFKPFFYNIKSNTTVFRQLHLLITLHERKSPSPASKIFYVAQYFPHRPKTFS